MVRTHTRKGQVHGPGFPSRKRLSRFLGWDDVLTHRKRAAFASERSVRKRVLDFCQPWLAEPLASSSSGSLENDFRFGMILNWPRDSPPKKSVFGLV